MSQSVEDDVLDIIAKYSEMSRDELTVETKLEDTGIDSMGVAEALFDFEDHFQIDIPDSEEIEDRFNFETIGDMIKQLEPLLAEKESAD